MMRFITLLGGGLDGGYLPVHPRYTEPPTHLAVFNPDQRGWLRYVDPNAGGVGSFDVFKIPQGVSLPMSCPEHHAKVFQFVYDGMLETHEAKEIERISRKMQRSGRVDEQEL